MSTSPRHDELEALASIFAEEDCFTLLEGDVLGCTIAVSPKCSDAAPCLRLCAGEEGSSPAAHSSMQVSRLPPISLHLVLHDGYPDVSPPKFHLASMWLSSAQLCLLADALEAAWGGPGDIVCYTWASMLESRALPILGITDSFTVSPWEPCSDPRVAAAADDAQLEHSRHWTPTRVLHNMLRYNDVVQLREFDRSYHDCAVCLDEKPGSQCVKMLCGHIMCAGCCSAMCRLHVHEGTIQHLRCVDPECGRAFSHALLKRLLSPEEFERWDTLLLQRTLSAMKDVAHCPRCSTVSLVQPGNYVRCSKCDFPFCTLCQEHIHSGACTSAAVKIQAQMARQGALSDADRAAKLEELRGEIATAELLEATTKPCPTCGMGITKHHGCNKVVCSSCNQAMCYGCGAAVSGYEHFGQGGCILFDQEEVDRWNAEQDWGFQDFPEYIEEEWAEGGPPQHLPGLRGQRHRGRRPPGSCCPCCGQECAKIACNNHIKCWACATHYCYLCRLVLVGKGSGGRHFGPSKCKQHTPG